VCLVFIRGTCSYLQGEKRFELQSLAEESTASTFETFLRLNVELENVNDIAVMS